MAVNGNASKPGKVQGPDFVKLAKFLGLLSSDFPSEREEGFKRATAILKAADVAWQDIFVVNAREAAEKAAEKLKAADEANGLLLARCELLEGEVAQLRSAGTAVAVWQDAGSVVAAHARHAQWALDQYNSRAIRLTEWEQRFLASVARRFGALTASQGSKLKQILDQIYQRTGLTPPA
jgi:hypothetical protein